MIDERFKPRMWLKSTCPYSFKFLLFVTEAGRLDDFELVRCDPDAPDYPSQRAKLEAAAGTVSFPTVETAPGVYRTDSDALIERYAAAFGLDARTLPTLAFYRAGLFPAVTAMHAENHELRRRVDGAS